MPWRVLRVLLRRRRIWPAPYLYVVALGVGLAVGGSLAVVVGPAWWWLVALAPPILAWVGFLMTASGGRDPTNDLLTDLLREIDPERHHRRYERRRAELFRHAPFPLYGLPPSWTGPRWLGGDETSDRTIVALELAHGNPDDGWLRVEMRSAPHEPDRTGLAHELWREAHPPPLDLPPARFGAWAEEQERAASSWQPEWEPVEIRVDERPIAGARIHAGDRFVVAVPIGGGTIVIRGVRWDPDWLELVSITDLDPYVEGPARARES